MRVITATYCDRVEAVAIVNDDEVAAALVHLAAVNKFPLEMVVQAQPPLALEDVIDYVRGFS